MSASSVLKACFNYHSKQELSFGVDHKSTTAREAIISAIVEIEELELFKSEHLRLEKELNEILHPNGDGPTSPSFCDLVAYVRADITKVPYGEDMCQKCLRSSFGNPSQDSDWCMNCKDRYDLNSFFLPQL